MKSPGFIAPCFRCISAKNTLPLCLLLLICTMPFIVTGCAGTNLGLAIGFGVRDAPAPKSRADLRRISGNEGHLQLSGLKLEDYHELKRFHKLNSLYFRKGGGATDEKLEALASLGFTNLEFVGLGSCPLVTDRGMEALSRIPSIYHLLIEAASITDHGLEILALKLRLGSVDISRCTNVTTRGLLKLMQIETLYSIVFSDDKLTEAEVIAILKAAPGSLIRMYIEYPNAPAQTPAVHAAAKGKNIQLFIEGLDYQRGPDGAIYSGTCKAP